MNIKIIDANDFNEFGGVTHADKSGNYKSLSVQEIRSALPTDGNNQFQYEPKFAPISGATGDIVLVSGVPGLDISVLNYTLICSDASTVQFFASGTGVAGTELSGAMPISANGCNLSPWPTSFSFLPLTLLGTFTARPFQFTA